MSGVTHSQIPVKQMLLRDRRRAKVIALGAVAAFTALVVAAVLIIESSDSPTAGTSGSSAQATQERSASGTLPPGTRYDGGPEEGSAALTQRSAPALFDPNSIKNPPGQRYDGGPEEGSAVLPQRSAPETSTQRYDGGPEEGTGVPAR